MDESQQELLEKIPLKLETLLEHQLEEQTDKLVGGTL